MQYVVPAVYFPARQHTTNKKVSGKRSGLLSAQRLPDAIYAELIGSIFQFKSARFETVMNAARTLPLRAREALNTRLKGARIPL